MAAGFNWTIRNGAGGTVTALGSSGNLQDFKSVDTAGIADTAANPIDAGTHSYEVWLRAHLTGTFTVIRDFRVWQSVNFSPATGLQVFWTGSQQAYVTPVRTLSTIATSSIPTADPGGPNVSIGGNLSGSFVASGYTDNVVLQLRTDTNAPAGFTSLMTLLMSYSET